MSRKVFTIVISLFCLTLLLSVVFVYSVNNTVLAQEWSSPQKEVWKAIEADWASYKERNIEALVSNLHPDFLGWGNDYNMPRDKASTLKWRRYYNKTEEVLIYEVKPVGIRIYGNVAIAHYYYTSVYKDAEGKKISEKGEF